MPVLNSYVVYKTTTVKVSATSMKEAAEKAEEFFSGEETDLYSPVRVVETKVVLT